MTRDGLRMTFLEQILFLEFDPAVMHHQHPVGSPRGLVPVMSGDDDGRPGLSFEVQNDAFDDPGVLLIYGGRRLRPCRAVPPPSHKKLSVPVTGCGTILWSLPCVSAFFPYQHP